MARPERARHPGLVRAAGSNTRLPWPATTLAGWRILALVVGVAATALSGAAHAAEPGPVMPRGMSAGWRSAAMTLRVQVPQALSQALAHGPVTAPVRGPAGELIGLYYFRARYYDPSTGRFLQRDPVWDPVNLGNAYTFVGNNPVTNMDPTGEIAWVPLLWGAAKLAAWGGLIGGASLGAADTYAQYQTTAGFTAGDWNAGETASIAGKGALVGMAGGFTFGLAAPAGAGALGYFGASSGWAAFGGAVLGGSAAGGVEGGVSWGLGLSGGSLAENVGRGALLGGLTGGVFHGAGIGAGRLGGPVQNWLRAGPSGGLRRNALAWHMNRFRLNSTRFYSVLSDKAADRLRAGGEPWPTGVSRANLGEGFYAWARRADAQGYLNLRSQAAGFDPSHGTSVRAFRIHNKTLAGLRRMDLTKVDGDAFQHFIDHHTMYADNFMPHGFEYVIYPRAIGVEHFFDKSVFHHFMGR